MSRSRTVRAITKGTPMSANEHETPIEAQAADRQAIAAAEEAVLTLFNEKHPSSLQDLRRELAEATLPEGVDRSLVRVAIWRLLNSDRLQLSDDRLLAAG
jgi:hypothetical protein